LGGGRSRRSAAVLVGIAFAGAALFGLSALWSEFPAYWTRRHVQTGSPYVPPPVEAQGQAVTTCFTPAQACAGLIVSILDHAQSQIRLQAYGFTSSSILAALVSAKRRGVDVIVILDKSSERRSPDGSAGGAEFVARAEIPVLIDYRPAIAHNKVIIVDGHIVVTGSYNFTAAAEQRNAENVTVIDSSEVASRFLSNWESRRAVSRLFADDHGNRIGSRSRNSPFETVKGSDRPGLPAAQARRAGAHRARLGGSAVSAAGGGYHRRWSADRVASRGSG
jgi:phosphatidylserine/phosphatidylglycerophosphate/cardiolipin synthase-like enzyme